MWPAAAGFVAAGTSSGAVSRNMAASARMFGVAVVEPGGKAHHRVCVHVAVLATPPGSPAGGDVRPRSSVKLGPGIDFSVEHVIVAKSLFRITLDDRSSPTMQKH